MAAKKTASVFTMIDVGGKRISRRMAIAQGRIVVSAAAFRLIVAKQIPKGNPLALAEVAGIFGAKRTADILPLCHPLPLDQVKVTCELIPQDSAIMVYSMVVATQKTGVEMEALMAVNAALLCIWDLVKATEPALSIDAVTLLCKTGGKQDFWKNPHCELPDWVIAMLPVQQRLRDISCAVLVLSDTAAKHPDYDKSGKTLVGLLRQDGASVANATIIADDAMLLVTTLSRLCDNTRLIITTGGTGVSQRDITAATLAHFCDKKIEGIGELLRADGANFVASSWLSNAYAGIKGSCVIVALPGSTNACVQGWQVLRNILPHCLTMMDGHGHNTPTN